MDEERALAMLEELNADDYQAAFIAIREYMCGSDLSLLKEHYEAPNHVVTATELASKVGFHNFNAANLRYGLLARKFLEFFQIPPSACMKLDALVYFNNPNDEWEWKLRKPVVEALKKLKWFQPSSG